MKYLKHHPESFVLFYGISVVLGITLLAWMLIPGRTTLIQRAWTDGDISRVVDLAENTKSIDTRFTQLLPFIKKSKTLREQIYSQKGVLTETQKQQASLFFDTFYQHFKQSTHSEEKRPILKELLFWGRWAQNKRSLWSVYTKVYPHPPTTLPQWMEYLEVALITEQTEKAFSSIDSILRQNPSTEQKMKIAQLLEWNHQPDRAVDLYLDLTNRGYQAALERLLELKPGIHRNQEIAKSLKDYLDKTHDARYKFAYANVLNDLGEYASAQDIFFQIIQENPNDYDTLVALGLLQRGTMQLAEALKTFQKADRIHPNNQKILLHIAQIKNLLGDYEGAFIDFKRLTEMNYSKDVILQYIALANSLGHEEDNTRGGELILKRHLANDPSDYEILVDLYDRRSDKKNLLRILKLGTQQFPQNSLLRLQLAWAEHEQGNDEFALQLLAQEPNLKPYPQHLYLYLYLLLKYRNPIESKIVLEKYFSPELLNDPQLFAVIQMVYAKNGKTELAMRYAAMAWKNNPMDSRTATQYAHFLIQTGQPAVALQVLKPFLVEQNAEALQQAIQIFSMKGDFERALALKKMLIENSPTPSRMDLIELGDLEKMQGSHEKSRATYLKALRQSRPSTEKEDSP